MKKFVIILLLNIFTICSLYAEDFYYYYGEELKKMNFQFYWVSVIILSKI